MGVIPEIYSRYNKKDVAYIGFQRIELVKTKIDNLEGI